MEATERELIARGQRGDDAAFAALHAEHARYVKAFFLRSGFGAADADDLTQEAFLLAFRSLQMFDPARGEFRPWVGAIARNLARGEFRRPTRPADFDPQLADEMFAAPGNPGRPPAEREEIAAVSDCVKRLPPDLAQVVRLRYVEGRTTRGIGAVIGVSEGTVRLRLKEAAGQLEGCLRAKGVMG